MAQKLTNSKSQNKLEAWLDFPSSSQIKTSLIITLILLVLVAITYAQLTPQIPLLYSLADPRKQLVAKIWVWLLPGLSLLINLVHLLFLKIFNEIDRFILNLFAWSTLILQIILLIISLRLILVVT